MFVHALRQAVGQAAADLFQLRSIDASISAFGRMDDQGAGRAGGIGLDLTRAAWLAGSADAMAPAKRG